MDLPTRQLLGSPVGDVGEPRGCITSSTSSGSGYSDPSMCRNSRTERSWMRAPFCSMAPIAPADDRLLRGHPEQADGPVRPQQAEHHVQRRGLARSVGPEEGDRLAHRDVERHAADGVHGPEGLGEAVHADALTRAVPRVLAGDVRHARVGEGVTRCRCASVHVPSLSVRSRRRVGREPWVGGDSCQGWDPVPRAGGQAERIRSSGTVSPPGLGSVRASATTRGRVLSPAVASRLVPRAASSRLGAAASRAARPAGRTA